MFKAELLQFGFFEIYTMLQFEQFQDKNLNALLSQSKVWIDLDKQLQNIVPHVLRGHFRIICIRDGKLVIYAYQPMVAVRLKILAGDLLAKLKLETVHTIIIKQQPQCCEEVSGKQQFKISNNALSSFEATARQLSHHNELAQALNRLVIHHKE